MNDNGLPQNRGFGASLLDLFSGVRLGIALVVLILLYSTIGSAIPPVRQFFELTEFQFFNHWIFVGLILLFCLNILLASVRRVRLRAIDAGAWITHAGLLLLCASSIVYFGRKIEGDVLLSAPQIRVISRARMQTNPDNAVLASVVAVKGKTWETNIPMLGGRHSIEVLDVEHRDMIAAAIVRLKVSIGDEAPQEIELSQLPSDDQAAHTGRMAAISENVVLLLSPANIANSFYDDTVPVLKLARGDEGTVFDFELPQLPYYGERFVPGIEDIQNTEGRRVSTMRRDAIKPLEYWRMPIPLAQECTSAGLPITMEIDGFLPYAVLDQAFTSGGEALAPMAHVQLLHDRTSTDEWLVAQVPGQSMARSRGGATIEYQWLDDADTIPESLTRDVPGRQILDIYVKDKDVRLTREIDNGTSIEIPGTDYKLQVQMIRADWPLMTAGFEGAMSPTALVWIESPTQQWQRSVLERYPSLNQDRDSAGAKIRPDGGLVDENIDLVYTDASRHRFNLVAGEKIEPTLIHTAPGGKRTLHKVKVDEPIVVDASTSVVVDEVIDRPALKQIPQVVAEAQRRPLSTVQRGFSMIRVHMQTPDGKWSQRVWVPFSHYNAEQQPDDSPPTMVRDVPGIGTMSLVYGRAARALPAPVTLERLETDFYPGRTRPSGWASYVRFKDPATHEIVQSKAFLNNTATIGPWTLYQATAARDNESWTGLGVGNRDGVLLQLFACALITLGMMYAFCVKPILLKRIAARSNGAGSSSSGEIDMPKTQASGGLGTKQAVGVALLMAGMFFGAPAAQVRAEDAPQVAASLLAIQNDADKKIDTEHLGSLVLQFNARYSTVEAWAQDVVYNIHGSGKLYGLDPVLAAFELMFNSQAYRNEPIIYVKDRALRKDITSFPVEITAQERDRIVSTGLVSNTFLSQGSVQQTLQKLANDALRKKPMDRLSDAVTFYRQISSTFAIVPVPTGDYATPWMHMQNLYGNIGMPANIPGHFSADPVPGVSKEKAQEVVNAFENFRAAWLARDVDGINAGIASLDKLLPTLAPEGVYPSYEKRVAEVRYHRMHLMRTGWMFYIAAFFVSIFAVATRYRWVRVLGLLLLLAAVGVHGYALGMRWYVIGRIPVASMYEAVVSSTWLGAMFGLVLEVFSRKRVYLLASALLGMLALALPELDIIHSNITTMMPILDDIMLRIHTVLIIGSYAVITLAFGVANCYLVVSAFRDRAALAQGTIGGQLGAIACLIAAYLGAFAGFNPAAVVGAFAAFIVAGVFSVVGVCSMFLPPKQVAPIAADGVVPTENAWEIEKFPGGQNVLTEFDRSHRVLLYTSMVTLFVGLVLGAVWADYSWGRPWGWDPKEVFALNTWLVYAVLIHARFIAKRRGLWTSVLSVCGFATMQFNWWVVNFYIVGLHSYA